MGEHLSQCRLDFLTQWGSFRCHLVFSLFLNTRAKGLSLASGACFDIVGRLFEDDVLSVERRWRQAGLFAVDRERSREIGILVRNFFPNRGERCTGQDVAFVAEDAVVQQGISAAVVQAEEGRSGRCRATDARFR